MEPIYIEKERVIIERAYNPKYGDDKMCRCGHPYYRHFDSYEEMSDVGCKYCQCQTFTPRPEIINYIVTLNGRSKVECETKEEVYEAMGLAWQYVVESPTGKDVSEFIPF